MQVTPDGVQLSAAGGCSCRRPDGRVCAVEVKAGSVATERATSGLAYLRDRLGDRFVAGLLFTTGSQAQRLGDRLAVAPIDVLWT